MGVTNPTATCPAGKSILLTFTLPTVWSFATLTVEHNGPLGGFVFILFLLGEGLCGPFPEAWSAAAVGMTKPQILETSRPGPRDRPLVFVWPLEFRKSFISSHCKMGMSKLSAPVCSEDQK